MGEQKKNRPGWPDGTHDIDIKRMKQTPGGAPELARRRAKPSKA